MIPERGWLDRWYGAILADPAARETLRVDLIESVRLGPANPVTAFTMRYLDEVAPDFAARVRAALDAQLGDAPPPR